jgi:hypothetical protein
MDLVRIGDKLVSVERVRQTVEEMFRLRQAGLSQAEVGERLGLDRTVVSRLESVGEIGKGHAIAVIGFPVANRAEVRALCRERGVEFVWVMSDRERRDFAESRSGAALIDEVLEVAGRVRQFDAVILMASNRRLRLMEALLDPRRVVPMVLGETPLSNDVPVDLEALDAAIRALSPAGDC